jgi:WD repeat-containing protein 35
LNDPPQANRHAEAARLLLDKASALAAARAPPLQLKKLHVLAALEVEAFRDATLGAARPAGAAVAAGDRQGEGGGGGLALSAAAAPSAAATLAGLMNAEAAAAGSRAFDNAWRGAEAYHFWLLAHRQLYSGQVRLVSISTK